MSIDERYAAGYAAGYEAGGKAALSSATHLTTMLHDRRTIDALRRLLRIMDRDEDESGSPYWHTNVDQDQEALPF